MSPRPISSTDSSRQDAFSHSHSSLPQLGDLHGGRYPPSPAVSNLVPPECPPSFSQGKPRFLLCPFLCRDPQGCPGPLQGSPSLAPSGSIRPEVQLGPGQAPEAELGLGGGTFPFRTGCLPSGCYLPLGNKTAEAGRPGGQGQAARARDAGPVCPCSVPAAGTTHPPHWPPPPTPGAELGSKFSPQGSRLTSNQGSQAPSEPFLRARGRWDWVDSGVLVGPLELGWWSHDLR